MPKNDQQIITPATNNKPDNAKQTPIVSDIPPLTVSFDDSLLHPVDNINIDLPEAPKPPLDPAKVAKIINYTKLISDVLEEMANKNPADKFTFKAATLYSKLTKGLEVSTEPVICVKNNTLHCYSSDKQHANGKSSLEIAAEAILALPEEKRPKRITLFNGSKNERQQFARVLRAKKITCAIHIVSVDAGGNKEMLQVDERGNLSHIPSDATNTPQDVPPRLRS